MAITIGVTMVGFGVSRNTGLKAHAYVYVWSYKKVQTEREVRLDPLCHGRNRKVAHWQTLLFRPKWNGAAAYEMSHINNN